MLRRLLSLKTPLTKSQDFNRRAWIIGWFILVSALEFYTPPSYVFGYLYTGPIIVTNARLSLGETIGVTCLAVFLIVLNLVFPGNEPISPDVVANRAIAVMALIVTGWLSDRSRRMNEEIASKLALLKGQEQLVRVREDFVFTLTHDLKTPLLGAIETLNSFRQGKFGSVTSTQVKVLETMLRSHQSSLWLVETLLDVYRNDTEGLKLRRVPVELTMLAEEARATLNELAQSRSVHLHLNGCRRLWVEGDALQLQRVFTNLLTNAIVHSRRGYRVEIVLESEVSYHIVKVLDNGLGITEDEFPHLFERFYQGSSDRQAKGSGLGLYLSRQIIAAHGGTIWAENRAEGGALFGFKLPAYHPEK